MSHLGLGYGTDSEDEDDDEDNVDGNDNGGGGDSDAELEASIRRKKREFAEKMKNQAIYMEDEIGRLKIAFESEE